MTPTLSIAIHQLATLTVMRIAGDRAPVHNPLDLSCMVDSAYSMADWSMNPSSLAKTSYASASPSMIGGQRELERDNSATIAALDSMYTALSSLGFQQVFAICSLHGSTVYHACCRRVCARAVHMHRGQPLTFDEHIARGH
jgi:hypothetical protein